MAFHFQVVHAARWLAKSLEEILAKLTLAVVVLVGSQSWAMAEKKGAKAYLEDWEKKTGQYRMAQG